MSMVAALMTSEEMDALPDADTVERWLIDGELWERPMSLRSPAHAGAVHNLSRLLGNWCVTQPKPRPKGYSGDIFCKLRRDPDTNVGVDVAVARPEQAAAVTAESRHLDGPPLLAVEVLSVSDVMSEVHTKTNSYLDNGTPQVWVVDPFDRTVTVYRPAADPVLYNRRHTVPGDPELPGLQVSVADIFE